MKAALVLAGLLAAARATPAAADSPSPLDAHRAEAAERFDRGIALLEEGDNAAALAELTRVQAIAPHPQVLFNIGLVYAAMNRPVEATRTLDQVLASPGSLPAASLERARRTRDEQARRVGLLKVTTNVTVAIQVDGIEVAKAPFEQMVPVAAGARVVTAAGPGYLPASREIVVAGQTIHELHLELAPSELRLAHLFVKTALPGAEVLVDGQRVGRTPLPSSVTLAPGRRVVELRRPGYRPAQREIALGDGATGELTFELAEHADGVAHGLLALAVSEPDPDITVDGQPRGPYRAPLGLPPGPHHVRVARAGFVASERLVEVPARGSTTVKVTLLPTPEHRAAYKERTSSRRRWAWTGLLGGAALAIAGGALIAVNQGPLDEARDEIARLRPLFDPGGPCEGSNVMHGACRARLAAADDEYNGRVNRRTGGLVALGVGVVVAGVGTALLIGAEDPERYDRAPREPASSVAVAPALWRGGGGVALAGAF